VRSRRWLKWVIAGAAVVVVLAIAGPFVYIHFIEGPAPAPLGLKSSASPSTGTASGDGTGAGVSTAATSVAGSWATASGSTVEYRVKEVLVGQDNLAVGMSHDVSGHVTIGGTTVTAASFSVRMATIHSDESERDVQFDGRIMDVSAYPTGTFSLTSPIRLAPVPGVGVVRTYQATGNLTLHGHTRRVSFKVEAERTASQLKISGSIPVAFADWDIPNPGFGSFVTTQNHGILQFLLVLSKA
jgi:polyisoprenoid-binding protein YceI